MKLIGETIKSNEKVEVVLKKGEVFNVTGMDAENYNTRISIESLEKYYEENEMKGKVFFLKNKSFNDALEITKLAKKNNHLYYVVETPNIKKEMPFFFN